MTTYTNPQIDACHRRTLHDHAGRNLETDTSLLQAQQVSFGYGDTPVLKNIQLQLYPGELVGLIGPNGAGKSTLLRLMMALNKPTQGTLLLNNQNLCTIKRRALARQITLVPQDAQVNYAFTVEEIVAMGRNPWLGRFQPPGALDMDIIVQAMVQTDTTRFARRRINELSGGERQRVLIARAIAQQTPVILLDEATANLDICHQLEVLELSQSLARQGHLVIAAIHDLTMASRYCDRLLLLAEQQLQADGPAETVITEQSLKQFFHLNARVQAAGSVHHGNDRGLVITALGAIKPARS